jgi:phosphoglycolate phosphatase
LQLQKRREERRDQREKRELKKMHTVCKASAQTAILRRSPEKLSKLAASDLVSRTDLFLFDCDGVLWKGDTAIPGASGVLDKLHSLGKRVCFVTNNSTRSRAGFLKKFEQLGLRADVDDIFTSSFAVAAYFQQNPLPPDKKCYIIGEEGIGAELDLVGIPHIGGPRDANVVVPKDKGVDHDPDVGAVVVGFDSQISYYKIQYAQLCINTNPGCRFLATNLDRTAHRTPDQEWAAGGAM